MKNFSFSMFNVISVITIIVLIILIAFPFKLVDLEQAERIAKWKSDYEKLDYCFSLVNLNEGSIIPLPEETGKILSDEFILNRIIPYFNLLDESFVKLKKYKYKKMNLQKISHNNRYFFNKFLKTKDGLILSFKQNGFEKINDKTPLYLFFVDINGEKKPNIIGKDIFFINVYSNHIDALGHNSSNIELKTGCSPISTGVYCSEYYLLGSRF